MPIISAIGRRSLRVRLTFALIYLILGIGAVSMLYPLCLMLAGSVKSETDFAQNTPLIEYLWNDNLLWAKYLESKYSKIDFAEQSLGNVWGSWQRLPPPTSLRIELADKFREFRAQTEWPTAWASLGHVQYQTLVAKNARRFRTMAQNVFSNNLTKYNLANDSYYDSWLEVGPPRCDFLTRRYLFSHTEDFQLYDLLKRNAAPPDWIISDLDAAFVSIELRSTWSTIAAYNAAHGTRFADYRDVLLSTRAPASALQRKDWERFVRHELGVSFIKIDPSAHSVFANYLQSRYDGHIELLNVAWTAHFSAFAEIPVPTAVPTDPRSRADFVAFISEACPSDALSTNGPRQAFEQFAHLAADSVRIPTESIDWLDFQQQKSGLRWEFLTRNYRAVLDYLLMHGNGIRNTAIFCTLMIASNLLVNPVAAYALSRYRPRFTYAVLLFCMATMAFPPEVTMIPSFLLLKYFPLYSLLGGVIALVVTICVLRWTKFIRSHFLIIATAALVATFVGCWIVPMVARGIFHTSNTSVSLLNTFWAIVLPGIANGFSIFLLKGFFDSLPAELYEAAELDGATEWHKFWVITMTLSKPILAVIALGVFTAAYSEFMMALVVIPDSQMWTMMVWLFQLQSQSHPSVVYASLVVAAVPTFIIFLFAQNLILQGIVVPTEK